MAAVTIFWGPAPWELPLGVKAYLEKTGHPGTVILYGCPGEEGGAAKGVYGQGWSVENPWTRR